LGGYCNDHSGYLSIQAGDISENKELVLVNRIEYYIQELNNIFMFLVILKTVLITIAVTGPIIFFIGANNPPRQILKKLLDKHQDSINKIMKS
jgi:hypothetical protein